MAMSVFDEPFASKGISLKEEVEVGETQLQAHVIVGVKVQHVAQSQLKNNIFQVENIQKESSDRETIKEQPYEHDLCPVDFEDSIGTQDRITLPLKNNHTCSVCGKSFRRKHTLNIHINSHTSKCCKEMKTNSRFECTLCEKSYIKECSLNNHMNTHSAIQLFKCEFCPKSFRSGKDLLVHNKLHSDEKQFKCKFCGKKFKYNSSRYVHQKKHSDHHLHFQCDICKIGFQSKDQYRSHMEENKCKENSGRRYKCTLCEKSYRHSRTLNNHMNFHRGVRPLRPYKCDICPMSFRYKSDLSKHNESHSVDKQYKCKFCDKKFKYDCSRYQHQKKHSDVRCDKCKKYFQSEDKYRSHLEENKCKENSGRRYKCTVCEKSYTHVSNLNIHMNFHRGVLPFKCNICPKAFRSKREILVHNNSHSVEKQYKCKFCDKKFKYYSSRYAHQKKHSDHHLHFQCVICKIDFQSEDQYRSHLEDNKCKENSGRRYKCTLCEKSYRHVRHLNDHMNFHRGVRPYKCDICPNSFRYKSELWVHNKSHSVEKQYKCKFCDKKFKHNSSRYRHQKKHSDHHQHFQCDICKTDFLSEDQCRSHLEENKCKENLVRRYKCTLCEKSYIKECSLNNHMNTHSAIQPFKCEFCSKSFRSGKELLVHNKSHSDEKQYKCMFCDKTFKFNRSRYVHQKEHSDHHLHFQCDICKIDFQSQDQHRSHLEENKCKENSGHRHKCTLCEKSYRFICNLNNHMNFHRGVRPYKCDICPKSFRTKNELSEHNNSHSDEKQYKCKFCDKKFKFNRSRYVHQKKHSDHHLHFQCDICKIDFQSQDQHRSHLEENKCKENSGHRHKCTLCEKSYRFICNLNNHMNFHRGVRPYKCDICPKSFRTKNELSEHNNSHSDEKQYKCKFCDKKFKFNRSRYVHQKKHSDHFQCDICKKYFQSQDQYRSHLEANKCKENTQNVGEIEKSEEQMQSHNEIEKIICEGKSQKKDAFEKKYKCDVCSKKFICKRNLSFHMRSHTK